MITKKAILKWWEERGRITNDREARQDLADFQDLISSKGKETRACYSVEKGKNGKGLIYTLYAKRWKIPLRVYFLGGEAINLRGF